MISQSDFLRLSKRLGKEIESLDEEVNSCLLNSGGQISGDLAVDGTLTQGGQAVLTAEDVQYKIYDNYLDFGVSAPANIADICAAMPDKSIFIMDNTGATGNIRGMPSEIQNTAMIIEVTKISNYRCAIKTFPATHTDVYAPIYTCTWRLDNGIGYWKKPSFTVIT
jgi:hypothetical protein